MRILIDMDGVITDLENGFLKIWRTQYPEKLFIPLEKRSTFYIADQYPDDLKSMVRQIYEAPGFYRSLDPIGGSLDAIKEMKSMGHEVFICTSPLSKYQNCVLEKYEWVDFHLGAEWVKTIILSKDKTIIKGDFLIDDKPNIDGSDVPSWQHLLFDQPYNKLEKGKKRLTWNNWKSAILQDIT